MSSKNVFGNEVSVDEQAFERNKQTAVDEDGFEVVDETPEFRATVEMEIQAKVDSNHPDAGSKKPRTTSTGRPSHRKSVSGRGKQS